MRRAPLALRFVLLALAPCRTADARDSPETVSADAKLRDRAASIWARRLLGSRGR